VVALLSVTSFGVKQQDPCNLKETCGACIQEPKCIWCGDPSLVCEWKKIKIQYSNDNSWKSCFRSVSSEPCVRSEERIARNTEFIFISISWKRT